MGGSILGLPTPRDPTLVRILEFCFIKRFYPGYNLRWLIDNAPEVCLLVHFYMYLYLFCLYSLVPVWFTCSRNIRPEFSQRLPHCTGWRLRFGVAGSGGRIGVERIHLPLFDLTCTLGTRSGRDPGRHVKAFACHGDLQVEGDKLKGWGVAT